MEDGFSSLRQRYGRDTRGMRKVPGVVGGEEGREPLADKGMKAKNRREWQKDRRYYCFNRSAR